MGELPPLWTQPSDFSSSVVIPPALLPGEGFSYTTCPWRTKYSLKSATNAGSSFCTVSSAQRRNSTPSAPNISGTSASRAVPPMATSRSAMRPTSGLAVMPDRPSEPPHLRPTTSSLTGMLHRTSLAAWPMSRRSRTLPASSSSGTDWHSRNAIRSGSQSPSSFFSSPMLLFSQPRPSTSTPPALGWQIRSQRIRRVCS